MDLVDLVTGIGAAIVPVAALRYPLPGSASDAKASGVDRPAPTCLAESDPAGVTRNPALPTIDGHQVRAQLRAGRELALFDVGEEAIFAQAHPLFAANLPLSRIEIDAYQRIPRRDTLVVLYDAAGEGLATRAAAILSALGYTALHLLENGLAGWRDGGGELFQDVNSPSKAFGELVESVRQTPALSAQDVKALIDTRADLVVLDARRFDEYHTMSIPGAISVPGAELVLRARQLAPDPDTLIVVNCAGRTRSIIGTQSLRNAGIPNRVAALRNGTIGWTLAGQQLDAGRTQRAALSDPVDARQLGLARTASLAVAQRAGVARTDLTTATTWRDDTERTTYCFDVRSPEEFETGRLPGFALAPGGQLVQETDHFAPVRGARIVLADDDGVRANMTASWLAQMGWHVAVVDGLTATDFSDTHGLRAPLPEAPPTSTVTPRELAHWLREGDTVVLDVDTSANHVRRHIPGAWFALRSQLAAVLANVPPAQRYVITCAQGDLAQYASGDLQAMTDKPVFVIRGGTAAWVAAGLPVASGDRTLASPRIDRYARPYEGTDNPLAAMQAYLEWEYTLVEQLKRDATHGFVVL